MPKTAPTKPLSNDDEKVDSQPGDEAVEASGESLSLKEILALFDSARNYTKTSLRPRWDKYYKVYMGERVNRQYEGESDPVIRESHTIIETLVANIAGGDPTFHFVKTNEEQSDDTTILNGMLDYFMSTNQMGLKMQEWVRDMLLYGTGILHATYINGKPFIENIPLRDFFVSPTATKLTDSGRPVARYAGHEYFLDIAVAKAATVFDANAIDPDTKQKGAWVPKYKDLDKVGTPASADDSGKMDKEFKEQFNNSTLGEEAANSQIRVIRLYDLDTGRLYEVGNRKAVIFDEETPCQREEMTRTIQVPDPSDPEGIKTMDSKQTLDEIEPFLPYAVLRDYVDSSLFYGEGEMAVIMGDAELLNDYESMDVDNTAYQNTPMYTIDPQFADLAPEIETIAGAIYPIPKGALQPMQIAVLGDGLDVKKDRIAGRMRRDTAADEAVQGVSQDQGRITATEVSSTLTQAQTRFSTKIGNLEQEGYSQLAMALYKYIQIFNTNTVRTRFKSKNGIEFGDYDPWSYAGEWEPNPELDTTIKRKLMEVGQKDNQIYTQLETDPGGVFEPVEVKRFVIQHIDPTITDEQFNKMLKKTPPGPSPEELKLQAMVQQAELEAVASIYDTASPFIKAQIEAKLQLQPDPIHEIEEQTAAVEHGAQQADLLDPTTMADNKPHPLLPKPTPALPPEGMVGPRPAVAPV